VKLTGLRGLVGLLLLAPALLNGQVHAPAESPQQQILLSILPPMLFGPQHVRIVVDNRSADSRSSASSKAVNGDARRWRPALVASAGLAVTGAAVAYWSTHKAEDAYRRYLHSAGAGRQQDALDHAERYDRIAGTGFFVMEAGLVLTARFVFF